MKKKRIVLTDKEKIENFFKKIGQEDLIKGIDINSSKEFFLKKEKASKKNANIILKAPSKLSRVYTPSDDDRIIAGYGSTDDKDWVDDVVTIDALRKAKKQLLRTGTNTVFWNHDTDKPVGRTIATGIDKAGLWVEVLISKAEDVNNLWTKIKEKIVSSFSIRFIAKRIEIIKDDNGTIIAWEIKELELLEVSVVGLPMNKEANIVDVRGKSIKSLFKKGVKNMKKAKKETITEVVKEMLDTMLGDKIEKAVEGMEDRIVEKMEAKSKKDDKKSKKMKAKSKKKEADEDDDEEEEEEDSDEMKKLKKEKADLEKELEKSKKENKSKKKSVEADEDDDEEEDDTPKKALKSVEDEDTCVFVLKCMDDPEVYNKLSAPEKKKATAIYFAMAKTQGKI